MTNIIIHHFCFFSRQYIAFCASNNLFRASAGPACSRSIYLPRLAQTGRVIRLKRKYISPVPWLNFCWFQTVHVWLLIDRNQEASIELMSIFLRCAKLKRWLGKFVCVDTFEDYREEGWCFQFFVWNKLLDLFGYEQNFTLFQHFDSYFNCYRNDLSINHLEGIRLNIFFKEFFWRLKFEVLIILNLTMIY